MKTAYRKFIVKFNRRFRKNFRLFE